MIPTSQIHQEPISQSILEWVKTLSISRLTVQKAKEDLPGLEDKIAKGEFKELRLWLTEKVHSKGSLYPSGDELMLAATGKSLEPSIFLQYLTEKYSKLYQL